MDSDRYKQVFVEEGREHIEILNHNLLILENNPKDKHAIDEVFRGAHTLKGMAGTLNFNNITKITHAMENILDEVRSGIRDITTEIIDILLECIDTLEELIGNVMESGQDENSGTEEILRKLGMAAPQEENKELIISGDLDEYQLGIIKLGMDQGLIPYWVEIELDPSCLLKAARAYLVFQTLEEYGDIIKSVPEVQDIEEELFGYDFKVLILAQAGGADIKLSVESISEIHSVKVEEVKKKDIEDKLKEQLGDDAEDKPEIKQQAPDSQATSISNRFMRSVRVDIDRLDSLMNLVSELIIIKNTMEGLEGYKEEIAATETMEYLSRVTNELHDAVMKVRMVPIEMVFNRFPRVVRDLARNTQKEIELHIKGAETEVDRTIIDEIGDPLIHLIRNAIDHGIEHPSERREVGKNPLGQIELASYHDGNNVVIEIADDGHGIDIDNIGKIALDKNFISKEDLQHLEDSEILDLMFMPGFSTAKSISDISGRGVGMDVVKTKVESMGGIINVYTSMGEGSRFTIRLPLTLSIIQALLVKFGDSIYAIPLSSVLEIVEIPKEDIGILRGQEVISYGNNLIPLIRIDKKLGIKMHDTEEILTLVIVNKGEKSSALAIGELIGQQEIVIKPLGKYLSDIRVIAGGTILGDGKLALILDINHLV